MKSCLWGGQGREKTKPTLLTQMRSRKQFWHLFRRNFSLFWSGKTNYYPEYLSVISWNHKPFRVFTAFTALTRESSIMTRNLCRNIRPYVNFHTRFTLAASHTFIEIKSSSLCLSIINTKVKHKKGNKIFKKWRLTSVIFRCLEVTNNAECWIKSCRPCQDDACRNLNDIFFQSLADL